MLIEFNEANFVSEVLESDIPVIVDFWAPWCGPCSVITPMIEELAMDYNGKLKIGKLNVDEDGSIAARYGIMNIPALLFFKRGEIVDRVTGGINKRVLRRKIEPLTTS